jgi:transposase
MYAIKLELKLNNRERTLMVQHAGFNRFVYTYGLALYKRVFHCQGCGSIKCRDENASLNLENAPTDRVRRASPELTPVDKKQPTALDEAGSKPQSPDMSGYVSVLSSRR